MAASAFVLQGCGSPIEISPDALSEGSPKEHAPKVSEFILGPGDRLEITVYRHDDLTRTVWIEPSGKIMYPWAGDIQAAGLSIFQLRDRIHDGLSRYIVDPQVSVGILSIQSQKIIVLGEVRAPGFFPADTPMSVLEAIARAGGTSLDAEQRSVLLIRGGLGSPELRLLNIEGVLKKGDLSDNIMLQGGDIIYMPRTVIADVSRFFGYLSSIISPIVDAERAYLLGDEIRTGEPVSVRTR
jgi:polysaccharide export outer membrane protein